jgi:hypothetical protein
MIFVSHAWQNGKPDPRVLQFVDFLRKNGYQAECDVLYQQQKTAIHFKEMMADALRKAEKTIIVLSENYKTRADNYQGGVGTEYRYIIDDFSSNENRYILVSFDGRSQKVVPDFLRGRDIVDLPEDSKNEYRELFSKLAGTLKYEFSPVAEVRTAPSPQKIDEFQAPDKENLSGRLGLDFAEKQSLSDLEKKKFLRESFVSIVSLLKRISDEFCSKNQYFQIEYEEIDAVTVVFELYKNARKVHVVQIWFGNLMGSRENSIFVGNNIGSKNSFSQMIGCKDNGGNPLLDFSFAMFCDMNNGTVEEVVKQIWEGNFKLYLRLE